MLYQVANSVLQYQVAEDLAMDEQEVDEVMGYIDTNGDGCIDFDEFIEMIKEIT